MPSHISKGEVCSTNVRVEMYIDSCEQDSQRTPGCAKVDAEAGADSRGEVSKEVSDWVGSRTETQAPEGGWGWMCVLGCLTVNILGSGMDRTFGVVYLILVDTFGYSAKLTGGILSVFSACRFCLGPVSSSLANIFTARKVVISGGLLSSLGLILSAFPPNIYYLFFTFGIVAGSGAALCYTPSTVVIGQYFHKKRALANGIASVGSGIGSLILPPFLTYLVYHYDYRGLMLIMGAIMLNQVVSGALYRPLGPMTPKANHERQIIPSDGNDHAESATIASTCKFKGNYQPVDTKKEENLEMVQTSKKSVKSQAEDGSSEFLELPAMVFAGSVVLEGASQTFKDPGQRNTIWDRNAVLNELYVYANLLKDISFLSFAVHWTFLAIGALSGLMFLGAIAEEHGVPRSQSAILYSILSIFDIASRIADSLLFDRAWLRTQRCHVYNILLVILGAVHCLLPEGRTFLQFAACASLIGLLQGAVMGLFVVMLADVLGPAMLKHTLGLGLVFFSAGTLTGPPASGNLKDAYGTYRYSFYFSGCCCFASAGFFLLNTFLNKKSCKDPR
ncbi:monocarboxylate transporter 12-B [Lingula anatina]|uniref:Monocarboxylate transporter 12-B n=1 Tax=Lingula anatina TaxID=7574 RepID=A0A1S3J8T0_LINAN|nr:monocarboxylate transporter 12-B [Lingula anatina]|eukprot:XP_013406718.1 monocarboxylate transporter 12-B [Lingula anatina]